LRGEKAFGPATLKYINTVVVKRRSDTYDLNEAIVSLATQAEREKLAALDASSYQSILPATTGLPMAPMRIPM
jgi:hypothetical protein